MEELNLFISLTLYSLMIHIYGLKGAELSFQMT
jgi:hypothetical protein